MVSLSMMVQIKMARNGVYVEVLHLQPYDILSDILAGDNDVYHLGTWLSSQQDIVDKICLPLGISVSLVIGF